MNTTQIPAYRNRLKASRHQLEEDFKAGVPITKLVKRNCATIDALLQDAWTAFSLHEHDDLCLIAVGGYGRQELHPYSDLDTLILSAAPLAAEIQEKIERFIVFLWDIGFEAGHSVRTLSQCVELARNDVTVITNLMEARLLMGCDRLFTRFQEAHSPENMWPNKAFFQAKWDEQIKRYKKYNETSYNLEPNIKHGPGGLRDIHMIGWVAKRYFETSTLDDLISNEFLRRAEYRVLMKGQQFLWRVTFALHFLHHKRESRLTFDNQKALAAAFGYKDKKHLLAIEQFMHDYYLTIKSLRELNDLILGLLKQAIMDDPNPKITPLNDHFQIRGNVIETTKRTVFKKYPGALLEIFLLLAQHPEIDGIAPQTIRQISMYRHLIDNQFRAVPENRKRFLSLLQLSSRLAPQLQRMNRYDLLGNYIPAFANIVAQMQYDLYHLYTVDQHIIFLVRNIERFSQSKYREKFPLCADIFASLPRQEILYLAAIFHDIAKGRGGDHSELGAVDAEAFCRQHFLSDEDTALVAWLVKHHLLMSATAQNKDIHDPEVIQTFAQEVHDQRHLDHLYCLTVADIHATNPSLWNSWRDSLLKELYRSTKELLGRHDKTINEAKVIAEKQTRAEEILAESAIEPERIRAHWQRLRPMYFLRENTLNIAWQTKMILNHADSEKPLIEAKPHHLNGATEIFIYTPNYAHMFSWATTILANCHVNIVEARIVLTNDAYCLASYVILDEQNQPINNEDRIRYIRESLVKHYSTSNKKLRLASRRATRRQRHFSVPTKIDFEQDVTRNRTILTVRTADRSGLLARIAKAFAESNIIMHNAKITTMGERVKDIFFITHLNNQPITANADQGDIEARIRKAVGG